MSDQPILTTYHGKTAIITLNVPKKLNALGADEYYQLARAMNEVAARDDIYITILTGKGRFFSAGADVTFGSKTDDSAIDERHQYLKSFVSNNLHITHAFYTHPKILITALNGPADRVLGFHLRCTTHLPPHALLLPRSRSRRKCKHRLRPTPRHFKSERGAHHVKTYYMR